MSQPDADGFTPGPSKSLTPIWWHDAEPARLQRDLDEVAAFAPGLTFEAGPGDEPGVQHHGVWLGRLPVWPFDRDEPEGLADLVPGGLSCAVLCSAAHPMLPPQIVPIDPKPEIIERSQHTWHVAPDGSLCLMQTLGAWAPETSVVDLLVKAAAWRVEYALMKSGLIEEMTERGIVNDPSLDSLVADAVASLRETGFVQESLRAVGTDDAVESSSRSAQSPSDGPERGSAECH